MRKYQEANDMGGIGVQGDQETMQVVVVFVEAKKGLSKLNRTESFSVARSIVEELDCEVV